MQTRALTRAAPTTGWSTLSGAGLMGAWVCVGACLHGCVGAWVCVLEGGVAWVRGCVGVRGCACAWVRGCVGVRVRVLAGREVGESERGRHAGAQVRTAAWACRPHVRLPATICVLATILGCNWGLGLGSYLHPQRTPGLQQLTDALMYAGPTTMTHPALWTCTQQKCTPQSPSTGARTRRQRRQLWCVLVLFSAEGC